MSESRTPRRASRDPRLTALAEESGYEILGRIGAGGMGIVYRAQDADGNDVAIKLLRHEIADDPRARDRLAREVAAQQRVRNDNIVRILDAELDSAEAFVVTEFVPGPTLEDAVRTREGLHPEAVREIGLVMGATLQQIHDAGVIHRDLKPSNVLLRGATETDLTGYDPDGDGLDPVIIDFGIAIAAEESRLTSTGLVMGTAAYLDPEVVRTDRAGEAGDWWAWAALLAFAATGREPFGTGRADLVFLRAERGEIDVDGLPVELADWLRSALRAAPAERPAPADLLARLAELDLSRYEDAGETEAFATGPRTAVLPVAGAAVSPASGAAPGATTPLPAGSERGGEPATEALPVMDGTAGHGEQLTEALPRITTPVEAPTEALPVVGPPTQVLPVVPEAVAAPPVQAAPTQPQHRTAPYAQPAPYAPTAPAAQPVPYAQPHAPVQHVATQGPIGPDGQPMVWPAPPPRRPVLVWLGHLLLVGLAAVAPYVSLAVLLLLGASARTWERSHRAIEARRLRGATGSGPAWSAGLASPFRFLLGLVETALQVLFPLILGLLVGIAVDAAWTLTQGSPPPDAVPFALAMAVTVLITWVGLGSRTTRNGAHRMLDAAAPDLLWGGVVLVLLLLLLGAVVFALMAREGMVDYFPFTSGPRLEDLALWRR